MPGNEGPTRVAIVTGASGITGRHCTEWLCSSAEDWRVITLSRRALDLECADSERVAQVHVNLEAAEEVALALRAQKDTLFLPGDGVFIFHCAYTTTGDAKKDCRVNLTMLKNVVQAAGGLVD